MRPSLLIGLYPSRWRRRYEDEFEALLEEEPWSTRVVVDILSGAVRARFDPFPLSTPEEVTMTARRIENTAAWAAGLIVLPALVLMLAASVQAQQPSNVGAGSPEDALRSWLGWLGSLQIGRPEMALGPIIAVPLALVALWRRLATDSELRADIRRFLELSVRLLRRPAVLVGVFAVLASLVVLVYAVTAP
jgi:hypothetical protein